MGNCMNNNSFEESRFIALATAEEFAVIEVSTELPGPPGMGANELRAAAAEVFTVQRRDCIAG
jgi:hypothetical protein